MTSDCLTTAQRRAEWPSEGDIDRRWNGDSGERMSDDDRRRIGMGVLSAVGRWCESVKALRRARVGLLERAERGRGQRETWVSRCVLREGWARGSDARAEAGVDRLRLGDIVRRLMAWAVGQAEDCEGLKRKEVECETR